MQNTGAIAKQAAIDCIEAATLCIRETNGNNRGKWVETYQRAAEPPVPPGTAWCACFAAFRYKRAAEKLKLPIPKNHCFSAYTPDWKNWAIKNGLWITDDQAEAKPSLVQPGDCALFYRPKLDGGRIGHIGIVTAVHSWGVETVEGNTNGGGSRDGDGVYAKHREWWELGEYGGFARMPF